MPRPLHVSTARLRRSLLLLWGLTVAGSVPAPAAAAPGDPGRLARRSIALVVRVALCPGAPAPTRSNAWVDEHVEAARALLAPFAIAVSARVETFTPARCQLVTRADRDELAAHAGTTREVPVLVVDRVQDLDVPSYDLMGVHWRGGGRRWIYLTARARPPVLAHELGHYFGLPHDLAGGTLMTPGPSSPLWKRRPPPRPFAPVLTAAQARRLRAGIAAWFREATRRAR